MPDETPGRTDEKSKGRPYLNAIVTYALAAILLICVLSTAYLVVVPQPIEKFTEFYLLGPQGKADNYPAVMDLGDTCSVTVGVVNHEYRDMDYNLVVVLDDGNYKVTEYTQKISLADDEAYRYVVGIKPTMNGTMMKLDFLLYADGDLNTPYRECYLYIDVEKEYYYIFGRLKAQIHKVDVA